VEATWEERMAARAARPHVSQLAAEAAEARLAFLAENGQHHASPVPPPPDVDSDVCRDCFAWRPIGNWPDVWVWHLTCRRPLLGNCGHAHHADEVWIG
jgi:hypothetical protein